MKKIIYLIVCVIFLACNSDNRHATGTSISTLPSFDVLLLDSTTIYHSKQIKLGNPTVFLYFNTDCPHCQKETKNILQHIDSLKNVQLYFLTPMSLGDLKEFNNNFHLSNYKNIIVGKDY